MSSIARALVMVVVLLTVSDAGSAQAESETLPTVTVSKVKRTDMVRRIPIAGTVVAEEIVEVNPETGGDEILEILVDVGDVVTTGQVLARVADDHLSASATQDQAAVTRAEASVNQSRSQILSAQASLEAARADQKRKSELAKLGVVAKSDVEASASSLAAADANFVAANDALLMAQASLKSALAQRNLARGEVARAEIRAVADGLIIERSAELGRLAEMGQEPLFRIARDQRLEVKASVFEGALLAISPGDPVSLSLAGRHGASGTVRHAPAIVDPVTRLGQIRIALDGNSGIGTGLSATGVITTKSHSALSVPATAVLTDATGDYVQVVNKGVVERRDVEAGIHSGELREIISGIDEGEFVLARAGAFYRDGDRVRPLLSDAGAAKNAGARQ